MSKPTILPVLLLTYLLSANAAELSVDKISDRIIILNEDYFRSVALLTDQGVVLIDTRYPVEKMADLLALIRNEFGTDSICYIINTHGCPEHILGNSAFPYTPAIMNHAFFKRLRIYAEQISEIDSLETQCLHIETDSTINKEACSTFDKRKNWRKWCKLAMEIKPDITFSEEITLYFDGLSVNVVLIGLGHGYSNFIYIPEEQFLHTSTINTIRLPLKYVIPKFMDKSEFFNYQLGVVERFINISDSLKYVVPGHGDYYDGNELKQLLQYYILTYKAAKSAFESGINKEDFILAYTFESKFSDHEIFKEPNENALQRHRENIDWLWEFFRNEE